MIKIAFAMLFRSDEEILKKTLPKVPNIFDYYIFLDTGSEDGSKKLITDRFPSAIFISDNIDHLDFGKWRNMMMEKSKEVGADWIVMIDTDETMFEEHYKIIFEYIEKGERTLYRLARINMALDNNHYAPEFYPDWQARVIKLDAGYYYDVKVHAEPRFNGQVAKGQYLPHCIIYHYSWTKPSDKRWLKDHNYQLTLLGKPILTKIPPEIKTNDSYFEDKLEIFIGSQP